MKTKQKKEMLSSFKRVAIYMVIVFPAIVLVSVLFNLLGVESSALIVFIDVLVGGTICFLLEVKHLKKQDKLDSEQKTKPKVHDPFSD